MIIKICLIYFLMGLLSSIVAWYSDKKRNLIPEDYIAIVIAWPIPILEAFQEGINPIEEIKKCPKQIAILMTIQFLILVIIFAIANILINLGAI